MVRVLGGKQQKRHAKCKNKYTEKQQKGEKKSHLILCNLNFKVRFAVTFPPTSPATELTNSEFASLPRLSQLRTDSFVHLATWKVGNIMFRITKIMEQWNFCTIYWSNMICSRFHCNYVSFLFLSVLFYFIFVLFHYKYIPILYFTCCNKTLINNNNKSVNKKIYKYIEYVS